MKETRSARLPGFGPFVPSRELLCRETSSVQPLGVQITTLNACILLRMWGWVALIIKDDSRHPAYPPNTGRPSHLPIKVESRRQIRIRTPKADFSVRN